MRLILSFQSVAQMIHPPEQLVGMNQTQMFMWRHLVKDVEILAKATGKSIEDTILFIHIILTSMLKDPMQHSGEFVSKLLNFKFKLKRN